MTPHSLEDYGMDVKGKVLLQIFNKRKLRNGTKTYLKQFFFSIYSQKLGFSAPFNSWDQSAMWQNYIFD